MYRTCIAWSPITISGHASRFVLLLGVKTFRRFSANIDVLLMPSIWEEPLARIMQDALAAGLVFVATRTGGTKEILIDDVNGLGFATDDPDDLARQIRRLIDAPALRSQLRIAGVQTAKEKFDLARMVDEIEAYLVAVSERQSAQFRI